MINNNFKIKPLLTKRLKGMDLFVAQIKKSRQKTGVKTVIAVFDQKIYDINLHFFSPPKKLNKDWHHNPEGLVAWGDGFNNLIWGRGYWAFHKGKKILKKILYDPNFLKRKSDKETIEGLQTALVKRPNNFLTIEVVDINKLSSDNITYAIGAPRVIRPGGEIIRNLLEVDSEIQRPPIVELLHDWRQVFKIPQRDDFPLSGTNVYLPIAKYLTELTTKRLGNGSIARKNPSKNERKELENALSSETISMPIQPNEIKDTVSALTKKDKLASYKYLNKIEELIPGSFTINNNRLYIKLLRSSTHNRSLIATIKGRPELIALIKQIDEGINGKPIREGTTIEESALLAFELCQQYLNYSIDQALEMCEGGDPRIYFYFNKVKLSYESYKPFKEHLGWSSLMTITKKQSGS